jgi:glycosyltransferase involved in cell wall biosynthesis
MLAAAATGIPFLGLVDSDDPLRRGVAGRRIAFRDAAPWLVASALLDRAGIGHEPVLPSVAGILVSKRPDRVGDAIAGFAAQSYRRKELVVGCHGFTADATAFAVAELGETLPVRIIEFDATQPLGQCLNAALETTSAQLIAKIDDDDFYGPHYLEDAIQANRYAGAALIGKGAMFTYLENRRETLLRSPKTIDRFYSGSPVGASLVFERSLWERVPFPHRSLGEDRLFIAGAKRLGISPYATSPYEFVYYRGVGHNTWAAVDEVFLEGAVPAWQGFQPELAVIDA